MLGTISSFDFTPPTILSPTCGDADVRKLWDYQVIWDLTLVSKMTNLIISVNPIDPTNPLNLLSGKINVKSVQD